MVSRVRSNNEDTAFDVSVLRSDVRVRLAKVNSDTVNCVRRYTVLVSKKGLRSRCASNDSVLDFLAPRVSLGRAVRTEKGETNEKGRARVKTSLKLGTVVGFVTWNDRQL